MHLGNGIIFLVGVNRSLKSLWLVLVACSVSFPISFLCRLLGPENELWRGQTTFLNSCYKSLSPWANQNLASWRIYCHLLVTGDLLIFALFWGMCFRGFVGAKVIHSFYLPRGSLSSKSVSAFSYFFGGSRWRRLLYLFNSLDQESINFCKGPDSKYFRFCSCMFFVFITLKNVKIILSLRPVWKQAEGWIWAADYGLPSYRFIRLCGGLLFCSFCMVFCPRELCPAWYWMSEESSQFWKGGIFKDWMHNSSQKSLSFFDFYLYLLYPRCLINTVSENKWT